VADEGDAQRSATTVENEWYEKAIAGLLEASRESKREYDKTLLRLATGGLAFSVTVASYLKPTGRFSMVSMWASWMCFAAALLLALRCFLVASRTHEKLARQMQSDHENHVTRLDAYKKLVEDESGRAIEKQHDWMLRLLGIGVVMLALCAGTAIVEPKETGMSKSGRRVESRRIEEKALSPGQVVSPPLDVVPTGEPALGQPQARPAGSQPQATGDGGNAPATGGTPAKQGEE